VILQRPSYLKIGAGEGAKTGVLSCETKWSKRWRGWGDLELLLITIAELPNEIISYRIFYF
jgi:hypothetical protein